MDVPHTRYARSGDLNIAYQVFGAGSLDLVYVPGWVSHVVEEAWESPDYAAFLRRLGSSARVVMFDKRGTGLSDSVPIDRLPTLEERMDDVRAVMDAAQSRRAAVFGVSEGGNMSVLFAASFPERTTALVTFSVYAKRVWSPDYPWAPRLEERAREIEAVERDWAQLDPSSLAPDASPEQLASIARYIRRSASPGAAAALLRMNSQIDVRQVLPSVSVPTLVLHRTNDRDVHVEEGRWIAPQIPEARFVELAGDAHLPWLGDAERVLAEIEEFLTGVRPVEGTSRVLSTILFTDIVGSTEMATRVGDVRWRGLLERHHAVVRGSSRAIAAWRSTRQATGSSPASTAPRERSDAQRQSSGASVRTSGWTCGRESTPANARSSATNWRASPFIRAPAWRPRPSRARYSSPRP